MPVHPDLLRRFPFFEPLSRADFERVARAVTRCTLPARRTLFRQGAEGHRFYMIISGTIEIYTGLPPNIRQFNVLNAGEWFGELSLIDNQPRSASARALKPCVLIALPKKDFLWLVSTYPLALFIIVATIQNTLRDRDRAFLASAELHIQQLEQLYSTMLDITRHRERDEALEAIRERAIDLLASAGGDLYLYDERKKLLMSRAQEMLAPSIPQPGKGCAEKAYATGRACIRAPKRSNVFELAAPIKLVENDAVEHTLGVLCVYRASDGAPYQEHDKTLLELFASQAAIVIENAQLYSLRVEKARRDGELNAARIVQASLIPKHPPPLPGFQLAAAWEPARKVSGDLYDFIELPDQTWGILIADVSDKGMAAALFMASARSIFRASANVGGSAGEIIERANRALVQDASNGMFVTAFLGILDPKTRRFSYVNAGHNYPFLRRAADASIHDLSDHNMALGILADFPYPTREISLDKGDLVLIYTDGVTEAANASGELFGEARLRQLVHELESASAREAVDTLSDRISAFTGAEPQSDDITVVALKRT